MPCPILVLEEIHCHNEIEIAQNPYEEKNNFLMLEKAWLYAED